MNALIVPVVLCAAYLVMVSVCICERMTRETGHFIRLLIAIVGGAGFWALCKAVVFGWGSTTEELIQGAAIVMLAMSIGLAPRVRTDAKVSRIANRQSRI